MQQPSPKRAPRIRPPSSYISCALQSRQGADVATDVIAEVRAKIEERLKELSEERQRLDRALHGFASVTGHTAARSAPRPRKRRRKRARPGERRKQFIDAVSEKPGITVTQIAKKIDSAPNPLYALARQLLKDGVVEKAGAGYRIAKETPTKKTTRPKAKKATRAKQGSKKRRGKRKS
jgi:transposase-like protein